MREIIKTSPIFQNKESHIIYSLVKIGGSIFIEKSLTKVTREVEICDASASCELFDNFVNNKITNRKRLSERISDKDAFILHYRDNVCWNDIGVTHGQFSGENIKRRCIEYLNNISLDIMKNDTLKDHSYAHGISENHLNMLCIESLERQRNKIINHITSDTTHSSLYESYINSAYEITSYLGDHDVLAYQFVDPYDDAALIQRNKTTIFTKNVYWVYFRDGRILRLPAEYVENLSSIDLGDDIEIPGLQLDLSGQIIDVKDPKGNSSLYTFKLLDKYAKKRDALLDLENET